MTANEELLVIKFPTHLNGQIQSELQTNKLTAKETHAVTCRLRIVWLNAIGFLAAHIMALYGLYLMVFEAKFLTCLSAVIMMCITGVSVTMGAHRLFSHKAFKANKWIRLALVAGFTLSGQNCLWVWIRDHRLHHKFSDTDADPHNAKRGFFFSHIGWLMIQKHPDVICKGRTIDMTDINADPIVMFQKRHFKKVFVIVGILIPIAVSYFLWNETLWNSFFINVIFRMIFTLNATWLVNSAAHIYGTRPYSKHILPKQNLLVSFLTFGEGWHNYHHVFPWDYRAAEYGQYFNATTAVIDYCAKKGWVYDLKLTSPDLVKKYIEKYGDGTYKTEGKTVPDEMQLDEN